MSEENKDFGVAEGQTDGKSVVTRSFRVTEDTISRFKEVSAEIGGSQQDTLAKLIDVYELEKSKMAFPMASESVSQFEGLLGSINRLFLQMIEEKGNIETVCRSSFEAQLRSKGVLIDDLQSQIEKARLDLEQAESKEAEARDLNNVSVKKYHALKADFHSLSAKHEMQLAEKNSFISSLTASVEDLRASCDAKTSRIGELERLISENDALAEKKVAELLERKQFEFDKEVLALRVSFQAELEQVKRECSEKISVYQSQCDSLLLRLDK